MANTDETLRRIVVETIIGMARDSQANFQLVSVSERSTVTEVRFDLYYPYRGIDGTDIKTVKILIETVE